MVANSTIAISNVARGVSRVALKPCRVVSVRAASTSTSSSFTSQNPYYPLYPSVHQLLSEKGIPHADISKIRATGPKGRLLKGDVLCYIGALDQDASLKLAQTLAKRDHLDLSNIKIAPPPAPAKKEDAVPPIPATAAAAAAAQVPATTTLSVRVPIAKVKSAQAKLSEKEGREVSLDALFVTAAKVANEELPLTAAQLKRINDEVLWNDILGVQTVRAPKYSRGEYVADVAPVKGLKAEKGGQGKKKKQDIIDVLAGTGYKKAKKSAAEGAQGEERVISVTVPTEDKGRGEKFLARLKEVLKEPAQLVKAL